MFARPNGGKGPSAGLTDVGLGSKTEVEAKPVSGPSESQLWVMGWTPPDGIYVPE